MPDRPVGPATEPLEPSPRSGPAAGSDPAIAGGRMNAQSNYRVLVLIWLVAATAATFAAIANALFAGRFLY